MLKVHDDLVSATNKLIKQTHIFYEKQIQALEKEIRGKDGMNLIMQQTFIKAIRSTQHFVDTTNHNFDEILSISQDAMKTVEGKTSNVDACDNLTKIANVSLKKSIF